MTAVKLLFIPGLTEAFFDGAIAIPIFGMSATFGFALGFILKAIGPALVIQLMFEVQEKRLGTAKGTSAHPHAPQAARSLLHAGQQSCLGTVLLCQCPAHAHLAFCFHTST